jgi:hypothetical protein
MARIGISITKSVSFRGATQEFSNVYYYQNAAGLPNEATAGGLIDEIVADEKTWHSTAVTFVRGRCWSQEGSPAANQMINQKNLSGTGTQSQNTNFDRERAFLLRLRAGNDSRGNPVYLRKWYHSCGEFDAAAPVSAAILSNTASFSTAQRNAIAAKVDPLISIGEGVEEWHICSKNGRGITPNSLWLAHAYLEHRQLGDMWRAQ